MCSCCIYLKRLVTGCYPSAATFTSDPPAPQHIHTIITREIHCTHYSLALSLSSYSTVTTVTTVTWSPRHHCRCPLCRYHQCVWSFLGGGGGVAHTREKNFPKENDPTPHPPNRDPQSVCTTKYSQTMGAEFVVGHGTVAVCHRTSKENSAVFWLCCVGCSCAHGLM
jgi:hypothetical protein